MRILTLFVRHGTAKYGEALEDLRSFQRRRLPGARHELLIIDNGREPPAATPGAEVIRGSNHAWEFSAWDDGLAHVGSLLRDYDLVHLVTSAFNTLYTRYIDRVGPALLEEIAGRAGALGHIDYYNEPVELLGYPGQAWLRSSFVFIPPAELLTLGSLVGCSAEREIFSGNPAEPFRQDAPVSATYRRYVYDWLTGAGTGQGVSWHSRFVLGAETLPFFQAKAMAIFNEQMLAIRLRRQGCALVDVTWLATVLGAGGPSRRTPFPHWRVQLAGRDTDAVPRS
jgi:hypothetical protein